MTATIHSIATRIAYTDTAHLPVYAQQQPAEDLQELSWISGTLEEDDCYLVRTIDYGDGRGRCIYLWLPDIKAAHRLTVDEALELVGLLAQRCIRPGKAAGSGRVGLRVLEGGKR